MQTDLKRSLNGCRTSVAVKDKTVKTELILKNVMFNGLFVKIKIIIII